MFNFFWAFVGWPWQTNELNNFGKQSNGLWICKWTRWIDEIIFEKTKKQTKFVESSKINWRQIDLHGIASSLVDRYNVDLKAVNNPLNRRCRLCSSRWNISVVNPTADDDDWVKIKLPPFICVFVFIIILFSGSFFIFFYYFLFEREERRLNVSSRFGSNWSSGACQPVLYSFTLADRWQVKNVEYSSTPHQGKWNGSVHCAECSYWAALSPPHPHKIHVSIAAANGITWFLTGWWRGWGVTFRRFGVKPITKQKKNVVKSRILVDRHAQLKAVRSTCQTFGAVVKEVNVFAR